MSQRYESSPGPWWPQPEGSRIGDAERDAVCTELAGHYTAGRLTNAEVDQRLALALEAQTGRQLVGLVGDLPAPRREPVEVGRSVVLSDVLVALLVLAAGVCTLGLWALGLMGGGSWLVAAVLGTVGGFTVGAGGVHLLGRRVTALATRPERVTLR